MERCINNLKTIPVAWRAAVFCDQLRLSNLELGYILWFWVWFIFMEKILVLRIDPYNQSPNEIATIVSRAEEDTMVVLTGDTY